MVRDFGSDGTAIGDMAIAESAEGTDVGTHAKRELGVSKKGLRFPRVYTRAGVNPFGEVEWDLRSALITNEHGQVVFEQKDLEFPSFWSQMATNVVASKYFRGQMGTPGRERSVKQLIGRVVTTIAKWGRAQGYFASEMDAQAFEDELTYLLLHQKASFNSPVWFNCGVEAKPQCSACFINSVSDTMDGILSLAKTEGLLFKWGSGTGTNFSSLRSSREHIQGGGTASGPVSFMKGFDAFAGVIKSGGRTRRAAKMVILNADHPDIVDYIKCKAEEEKKAWALIDAGYDPSLNGPAYASIFFQNSNNSVRVTDEFMRAVEEDGAWSTKAVTTGEPVDNYRARDLMDMIAEAAHQCGDPGLQFDTTINDWHTCPNTARINASNPCVTGDTMVATTDGWRRIDSLVGRSARVIGADGAPHFVSEIFATGTKPVFRLRTKAGYEVRITADHKVLTGRGDVAVKDLAVGDTVTLQAPGFGRRALGEKVGLAVGVAVGDGCLVRTTHKAGVQEIVILTMSSNEVGVLQDIAGTVNIEKQISRVAGMGGRADDVHVRPGATGPRLAFSSRSVVSVFKEIAVLDEGSHRKRFTPAVFELDRSSLAGVLRGLFTADGTVANSTSKYVSLDSSSEELLSQVQLLLLSFGIKSRLYRNRRNGRATSMLPDGKGGMREYPVKEMHSLRVSRSSRVIFEREIGFHPASPKAEALSDLNDKFGSYLDELTDEIASIDHFGAEPVYDLTEKVTSHFVANGLVVHNCSEYLFIDDSACNLASLNLMKFLREDRTFDTERYKHAAATMLTAQEIIVDNASYPTAAIEKNSHDFRPLGLGYANLGALLMSWGVPYDSDRGRAIAGALTALMHGEAYAQSARIAAEVTGPFPGYEENREPMQGVIKKHWAAVDQIDARAVPREIMEAARSTWKECWDLGSRYGYRNSQVTVIAPTGTIAFMMDCDTTGVEPDIALVKYKKLAGGGMLKIVNNTVPEALRRLGYGEEAVSRIVRFIDEHETIEGAPGLKDEHLPVFDCAFKPKNGTRTIAFMGHIRMMEAVQPFLSGAISKTVNMPEDATPEDIAAAYLAAWKGGLKAIAIYRDGSKRSQPLSTSKEDRGAKAGPHLTVVSGGAPAPKRRRLPDERKSITHKFSVGGHDGYLTVGMYEDGSAGEIFIVMAKAGSTLSGVMDSFATAVSLGLQHGVPLELFVSKFAHVRFEPHGFTKNPDVPIAKSIVDYIFRWLGIKFLGHAPASAAHETAKDDPLEAHGVQAVSDAQLSLINGGANGHAAGAVEDDKSFVSQADAPPCTECGSIMVRRGACYSCLNCGATSGCS